jgi:uncharacterized membrane protein
VGSIEIFQHVGLEFLARWAHVLMGITWIGLLYYFNVVQVPSFAQMDPAARNNAIDKLASRALWWFRWAAAATFAFGVLLVLLQTGSSGYWTSDYVKSPQGMAISAGMLFGITMFLNVWLVIWPNQKIVIANARNVQAGGEADPAVPAATRKAGLASRQNTIFSLPMLFFMVGTAHFFNSGGYGEAGAHGLSGGNRAGFWIVILVIWAVLEANALGLLFGTGAHVSKWMYEHHKNAIITGGTLVLVVYIATEIFLK